MSTSKRLGKAHAVSFVLITLLACAWIVGDAHAACPRGASVGIAAGGGFTCNGQPFQFVAANSRDLLYLYNHIINSAGQDEETQRVATAAVYEHLKSAADMGVSVMRIYLPRENIDPNRFDYHDYIIKHLEIFLDFAIEDHKSAWLESGDIDDYRRFRKDDLRDPPAPDMRFLVVLSDSLYSLSRGTYELNLILNRDKDAYQNCFAPDLCSLNSSWYRTDHGAIHYRTNYLPFVHAVAQRFAGDGRIFAYEPLNEGHAENAAIMSAFIDDVSCTIRGWPCTGASSGGSDMVGRDSDRLIGSGFISTAHAAGCGMNANCVDDAHDLFFRDGDTISFGSVHEYDADYHQNNHLIRNDYIFFRDESFPFIIGEYGQAWVGASREHATRVDMERFYAFYGAGGVFQWAFYGSGNEHGAPLMQDGQGMDQSKSDWSELFATYRCRALSLGNQNRSLQGLDIALGHVGWSRSGVAGAGMPNVGEPIQLDARICNVGSVPAVLGQSASLYLTHRDDHLRPVPIGEPLVSTVPLNPGEILAIQMDWTAEHPGPPYAGIGPDEIAIRAVTDENLVLYPADIDVTNNRLVVPFPLDIGSPRLSFQGTGSYGVGTDCSNPSSNPVAVNWRFRAERVPADFYPVRLEDGLGGIWVKVPPCNHLNNWPFVETVAATPHPGYVDWILDVAPWPNPNPVPGRKYILELRSADGRELLLATFM